jgi:hypothetical protein
VSSSSGVTPFPGAVPTDRRVLACKNKQAHVLHVVAPAGKEPGQPSALAWAAAALRFGGHTRRLRRLAAVSMVPCDSLQDTQRIARPVAGVPPKAFLLLENEILPNLTTVLHYGCND